MSEKLDHALQLPTFIEQAVAIRELMYSPELETLFDDRRFGEWCLRNKEKLVSIVTEKCPEEWLVKLGRRAK